MDEIEKLLIRKWDGTATEEELATLAKLMQEVSPEEREAYENLSIYWKSEGEGEPEVNQHHLWNRLEEFIDEDVLEEPVDDKKGVLYKFRTWRSFGLAASILILCGIFVVLWTNEAPEEVATVTILEKVNPAGQKTTTRLPDGSLVILNSSSKLLVPERFDGDLREVTLEGEAYFEIVSNPDKPFVVNMADAQVEVLGTAFNLERHPSDEQVVLNVVEGKVRFSGRQQSSLIVTAEQAAALNIASGKIEPIAFDHDAIAWSRGELVFNSASFEEIVQTIEDWYGVEVKVTRPIDLGDDFTGRYTNAPLDKVLTGISFSTDASFSFEIDGKQVLIK